MFDDQKNSLLANLETAHDAYHRAEVFGGPSLHFHLRSLEASRAQDFELFSEYVYAMLASWGMHRMGSGGSKMRDFDEFSHSLRLVWPEALQLQNKDPSSLSESDWESLKVIFCGIRCMASGTSLVGNSKVMAHLIPNIIPPVDRRYTLNFLFGKSHIINGIEGEWDRLTQILRGFFIQLLCRHLFNPRLRHGLLTTTNLNGTVPS